jgi:hypothetical protein
MGHISALGLFDYLSGKSDLTAQEIEHLNDCDDCREEALELRCVIEDSAEIEKARRFLAEEGRLPLTEPPAETHEEQRELDERPGL